MNKTEMPELETTGIRICHEELRFDERKSHRTVVVLSMGECLHFIGIAKCDKRDQFAKKKGRLIAYGRAKYARAYYHGEANKTITRPDLMFGAIVNQKNPSDRTLPIYFQVLDSFEIMPNDYSPTTVLESLPEHLFAESRRKDIAHEKCL